MTKQIQKAELSDLILTKSKELIILKGYENLNIREIVKKVGCSIGTVYNYHKNLNEIILKINQETLTDLHNALEKTIKEKEGNIVDIELFSDMAVCYMRFALNNKELWRSLFKYSIPKEEKMPEWLQESINDLIEFIDSLVYEFFRRHDSSLMSKVKSKEATTIIWSGLHGISSLVISGKIGFVSEESAENLAKSFITSYLKGVIDYCKLIKKDK